MKINRKEVEVIGSGRSRARGFTISDVSMVADLLSNMYPNPIRAVVREYACNALDSHIAAECPEKPITVVAPTIIHPYFEVIDEGVGMNEEEVYELMTNYGGSSKRHTNSLIGGKGIGSKSGFAYKKNFRFVTTKDGKRLTFHAFWGTHGPDIELLTERTTSEPNGVRFTIKVDRKDIVSFCKEIRNVCRWFDVPPIIQGMEPPEPLEIFTKGDGYLIFKESGNSYHYATPNNVYIKMGPVIYNSEITNSSFTQSAVLEYPIGTFEIAPSRETLILTEDTKTKIRNRLEEVYILECKKATKEVESQPTLYEAVRKFLKVYRSGDSNQSNYLSINHFKWRSISKRYVHYNKPFCSTFRAVVRKHYDNISYQKNHTTPIYKISAIFDTEGKSTFYAAKVKRWLELNPEYSENLDTVLVLNGTPKQNLREWVKAGKPEVPYFKYSDIPMPSRKEVKRKPKKVSMKSFLLFGDSHRRIDDKTFDLNDNVPRVYLKIIKNNFRELHVYYQNYIIHDLIKLTGIKNIDSVVLVPKTLWNKIPSNWKDLEPLIDQALEDYKEIAQEIEHDKNLLTAQRMIRDFKSRWDKSHRAAYLDLIMSKKPKVFDGSVELPSFPESIIEVKKEDRYTKFVRKVEDRIRREYPLANQYCDRKATDEYILALDAYRGLDKGKRASI